MIFDGESSRNAVENVVEICRIHVFQPYRTSFYSGLIKTKQTTSFIL